ncbi:DUF799 domain-containing protein [Pulveribacter suum]|uniref:Lipoprotein n=1 Tax=Pulveribacter suum TaxID=2116657 RepID=A0A2P1NNS0_9BURK|nr:DUF799 domain-containing protein [Pulveribacter suum]AVP58692.1 hypothetical protein C7H73_14130 [Pulveribacter suum]
MISRIARRAAWTACAAAVVLLTGCAAPQPYDYTALRQAKPQSIVVLPPLNQTPEVAAPAGVLSSATRPLAESGYYVLPVAVTDETFRENGIISANDAQELPLAKLREIFGADAALYLDVRQYGSVYAVVRSETRVTLHARLVDLRTGEQLWNGEATASTAENKGSGGSVVGMLVSALIDQIVETLSDRSVQVAEITNGRLLYAGRPGGLLHGPRSPLYGKDGQP